MARKDTLAMLLLRSQLVLLSSGLVSGCGVGPWQREVTSSTRSSEHRTHAVTQLKVRAERDLRSVQLRISELTRCTIQRATIRRDTVHETRSFTPVFYVEVGLLAVAAATPIWYRPNDVQEDGYDSGGSVVTIFLTLLLVAPTLTIVLFDATAPKQRRASSSSVVGRSSEPGQLCEDRPLSGASLELKFSDGTRRTIHTDTAGYARVPVRPDLVLDVSYQGAVIQRVDIYAPETEPEVPEPEAPVLPGPRVSP